MSGRQVQEMLRRMASGTPVELTSRMASVKKLARLAGIAQQFGYEYADVRQGSGLNGAITMLLVPDPGPEARARAAQNWAQYPNAGDGVSVPPVPPESYELLKTRINYDYTGKIAERGMSYGALGATMGCAALTLRLGGESGDYVLAGGLWLGLLVLIGVAFLVNRKRNARFGARLQQLGFVPVREGTGRVRYLPPGTAGAYPAPPPGPGGHAGPPAPGAYAPPSVPGQYPGAPAAGPYAGQPSPSAPGPYPGQPASVPGPYAGQPAPGPYAPGPYASQGQPPQQPQPPSGPPRQSPHWQPPQG
ncbi:hypothetical protein [Streptomyces poriticola]|uniref:hypothetical protein n=1 Tax=Streptomyces poriticola TaxID=3120506 RepID=UPI002FCE0241